VTGSVVDQVINSVLYEGYLLYPYRLSSIKNQHRFNFGIVFPKPLNPSSMATECLIEVDGNDAIIDVEARFLQVIPFEGDHNVVERRVPLLGNSTVFRFGDLRGEIQLTRSQATDAVLKIQVRISNFTQPGPLAGAAWNEILSTCFVSTHLILRVRNGKFVSMLDPPPEFRKLVDECNQEGTWPVLIGRAGERECMLASPIILYDYPHVAPESPENLFDGTEIDEILLLRILSLTAEEKEEVRKGDPRGRFILERAESLAPEDLLRLHGARRDSTLKSGDRVRLHPKPGADAIDTVLAGRTAIVEAIEEDFEKQTHIAVVIEDDPGRDLGLHRQPGHRFFFSPDEVEIPR